MSPADDLFHQALELSTEERAELAKRLLDSLNEESSDPLQVRDAWAREIERRAEDILAPRARTVPAEEVFARARKYLRKP